jgi:hypothetical protein
MIAAESPRVLVIAELGDMAAYVGGVPVQKLLDVVPIDGQTAIESPPPTDGRQAPEIAEVDLTERNVLAATARTIVVESWHESSL